MNITIVSPVFNELEVIGAFIKNVKDTLSTSPITKDCAVSFLLVDDGSTDGTLESITRLASSSKDIRFISFLRNAGHQIALCAGLANVDGNCDIIITMDSDLEHPPEVIPLLVEKYRKTGSPIISSRRQRNHNLPKSKRLLSMLFYKFMRVATGIRIEEGSADFRLYEARLIRQLGSFIHTTSSLRLLAAFVAPDAPVVEYDQSVNPNRISRFTLRKNLSLLINSLLSFSEAPGFAMAALGVAGVLLGGGIASFSIMAYMRGETVPGWASIIGVIVFFSSLNLGCLSLLFIYLSRHLFRAKLPKYIIRRSSGCSS
jgi:dolichol-phosphate mannosyltransferase